MFVCFETSFVDVPSDTWWLDSGASVHITNTLQGFISKRMPNKDEVSVFVGKEEGVRWSSLE